MTQEEKKTTKGAQIEVSGELNIEPQVIASIVGMAASEVEGVATLGTSSITGGLAERLTGKDSRGRGVEVEAGKKEAILDLTLKVIYGFSIPEVVANVRLKVADRLLEMVGLVAKEININVVDIEFPERLPGKLE